MELLQRFKNYILQNDLFHPKDKLLLAVSGGVDSVVLCELCHRAGYDFSIVHCNFQLRGADSDRDELFVKQLAANYEVEFFVKRFDTKKYAEEKKLSIQEAARDLRYDWFAGLVDKPDPGGGQSLKWLLTAHHADDNIETVLMNFFRGTGIRGLTGMEPRSGNIIRPLLFAGRKELEEFLDKNKLSFVEDYSNLQDDYTRNYFRNQLIPSVIKVFPEARANLLDNIKRFRDAAVLYSGAIELYKKKLLERSGNEIHIPVLKLKKSPAFQSIVYEIIKDYGFTARQVEEVIHLLDSEPGKFCSSPTHRVIKNRNWMIIAPLQTRESETILIEKGEMNIETANFNIQFSVLPVLNPAQRGIDQASNNIACLDADEVIYPLILRKWKQGDYFYPLGMKKKKKLARFFIDQKLSRTEKENVWVIESRKRILWIIGYRIDNRFRITEKTKSILRITLNAL